MEILQLSRSTPGERANGRQRRVWETTKKLSDYGNIWLTTPTDSAAMDQDRINVIPLNSTLFDRKSLKIHLWTAALLLGWSNPVNRAATSRVVSAVRARENDPDLVVCEAPQMLMPAMKVANDFEAKLLLNKHNVSYENNRTILGELSVPQPLVSRAVESLRKLEQTAINEADAVVFQSESDVESFDTDGVFTKVIPNGTNMDAIQGGEAIDTDLVKDRLQDAPVCIFVGSYDYYPNTEAARTIIDDIAPSLPDVRFLLVGRNPPATPQENIQTTGFVEDLGRPFSVADIALCPLYHGSGTKLKVMDYMAAELPIVVTETGAKGIDLEDGETALIRDTPKDFVSAIEQLLDSPDLRNSLSERVGELAKDYTWDTVLEEYDDVIRRIME